MLKNGQTYFKWQFFNIFYEKGKKLFENISALTSFASRPKLSRVCIPHSHAWISPKTKLHYSNVNYIVYFFKKIILVPTVLGHSMIHYRAKE